MRTKFIPCFLAVSAIVVGCARGETDPDDGGNGKSPFGEGESEETETGGEGAADPGTCAAEQFQCGSGECLAAKYACDGTPHCVDASDEYPILPGCALPTCDEGQFACTDGACVPSSYACDGYADCADSSDEAVALCGDPGQCTADQWQCVSGECIPASYYCDGIVDCSDSSDEACG